MLNFDMVASPNFVRFVYDGDLSDSAPLPGGAPPGSAAIETLFLDYFASQGLATRPTAFDGRSDCGPFIDAGIPAGGLFTGAEGIKTASAGRYLWRHRWRARTTCYHLADDIDNLSLPALDQMSDAAAHATISLAQSTQAVNSENPARATSTSSPPNHPRRSRAFPAAERTNAVIGAVLDPSLERPCRKPLTFK